MSKEVLLLTQSNDEFVYPESGEFQFNNDANSGINHVITQEQYDKYFGSCPRCGAACIMSGQDFPSEWAYTYVYECGCKAWVKFSCTNGSVKLHAEHWEYTSFDKNGNAHDVAYDKVDTHDAESNNSAVYPVNKEDKGD